MAHPPRPVPERFAEWVTPEPNSGCLLWTGYITRYGYGEMKVGGRGGRPARAHRVAWELVNGPIPAGLDVLHHCDNRACVMADPDPRKSHLFLGTNLDNIRDMDAKGRRGVVRGADHYSHRCPPELRVRGERHGRRKLTEAQALEVLARVAAGEMQKDVARDLGVSKATVNLIVLGRNWAHLPRPAA